MATDDHNYNFSDDKSDEMTSKEADEFDVGSFDISTIDFGSIEVNEAVAAFVSEPDDLDDFTCSSVARMTTKRKNDESDDWERELKKPMVELKGPDELKAVIKSAKNVNTVKKTMQVVTAFQRWLSEACNEERPIENIMGGELDQFISNYILQKKKPDGGEHEPDSLTAIHRAIARHLSECDYPWDVMKDKAFEMSRGILNSKRIQLKAKGLGNKPNRSESLDDEEIERLWQTGIFGASTPRALQNTLYWSLGIGFGLRGSHESKQMLWGDVELFSEADGTLYLEFTERCTKTRNGALGMQPRPFPPKIYETKNPDRCPVQLYKMFSHRRPPTMMEDASPFYLTVKPQAKMQDEICYAAVPMGINTMRKIISECCKSADIPGKKTNHSIRKTSCEKLLQSNVPPTMVQQLSGHKNVQSLNNYSTASRAQQRAMSTILNSSNTSSISGPPLGDAPTMFGRIEAPSSKAITPRGPACPDVLLPARGGGEPGQVPSAEAVSLEHFSSATTGMFAGATITGNIHLNVNYHVSSNRQSNVNVSPKIPAMKDD